MKHFFPLVGILLLAGCANSDFVQEKVHLVNACNHFDEFQNTLGYDNRRILLASARSEFRQAAFISDKARYEVLAEYTEGYLDRLGNLVAGPRVVIENFCKELNRL